MECTAALGRLTPMPQNTTAGCTTWLAQRTEQQAAPQTTASPLYAHVPKNRSKITTNRRDVKPYSSVKQLNRFGRKGVMFEQLP